MSRVDFYHLQKKTLEDVLPLLLQKAYGTGKRVKIKVGTEERVEFLNSLLWTFNDESFYRMAPKKTVLPSSSQFGSRRILKIQTKLSFCFWSTEQRKVRPQ